MIKYLLANQPSIFVSGVVVFNWGFMGVMGIRPISKKRIINISAILVASLLAKKEG